MKHIIDIDAWERRDNYGFFRNFVNSWYSVTTEIDCTEASAAARAAKRSFFLYYLYAVVRSANEVDELRYRTDKEGRVVFSRPGGHHFSDSRSWENILYHAHSLLRRL